MVLLSVTIANAIHYLHILTFIFKQHLHKLAITKKHQSFTALMLNNN